MARVQLQLGSLGVVALGAMASLACHRTTQAPWRLLMDVVLWPKDGHPTGFLPETMQVNAVLGGVMVGWGTTLLLAARGPLAGPERSNVAWVLLVGLLCWFVVDSTGSYVAAMNGNILLNIVCLVVLAPPLWVLMNRSDR